MKKNVFKLIMLVLAVNIFNACSDDCDTTIWYADADGDGFGNPNSSMEVCNDDENPAGYVTNGADADDTDDEILDVSIWTGADLTFSKAASVDWTMAANQDQITDAIALTRQNNRPIYNYQWWQDNHGVDAEGENLEGCFWGDTSTIVDSSGETVSVAPNGGTKGLKWAILDDTGFDATSSAADFQFYGTLGNPANFYSFGAICTAITQINDGSNTNITLGEFADGTQMTLLIGKKLGVWIVDEDIYFTLTFSEWGSGGSGGAIAYTRSSE